MTPWRLFQHSRDSFLRGVDPVISLPSTPVEAELHQQAVSDENNAVLQPPYVSGSAPEPEKMEADVPLPPPAPGLPTGCPAVCPEELTKARGGHVYPPLSLSLPESLPRHQSGHINAENSYSNTERLRCFEEEERRREERELVELRALVDGQIREREKTKALLMKVAERKD